MVRDEQDGPSTLLLEVGHSVAEEEDVHVRAMQMDWIEAFDAELALIRTDRTTCVSGSISELAKRLLQPIFEGSPILVGDYCVSQLHVRELIRL